MNFDFSRYRLRKGLILAFHGCDDSRAEAAINHGRHLRQSANTYDWLGHGIYFWENNPERALEWAMKSKKSRPAVVGAVLDLGHCLDLTESVGCDEVGIAYESLADQQRLLQEPMPANHGRNAKNRELDCSVLQHLHHLRSLGGDASYTSVRAAFHEDAQLYPGASFSRRAHIQICVRDPACILGYFKPAPF